MPLAYRSRVVALIVFACLLVGCSAPQNSATDPAKVPAVKRGDQKVLRVDLNQYTPGVTPQGIGEPNEEATHLAREWEALNPGARIKYQLLVNTGSSEGEFLRTQLLGGIAPEIVSANAETVWPHVDKGWYIALDDYLEQPNPYVEGNEHWIDLFTNQALVGSKRAPDGKLYTLPIDIVETGLFYNKDILRSVGYEDIPDTWQGMMEMLATIYEQTDAVPMTADMNLASDWGQDIVFEMLYHDIIADLDLIPSRPDAEGYLGHYLDAREAAFLITKGFFTSRDPRWREMNRILREWRTYWAKELKNSDPVRQFLTQRLAVYWSGSWFIRRITTDPYVDFEWGVSYIPTITKETSPYGSGTLATVIGGAGIQLHVTNSAELNGNLDECIDFLMFITAPQNMERLASEALLFIPNINGAKMADGLEPFRDIFQRRYCSIKWLESMDGRYKKYWRRMLDYYLEDGVDLDTFLDMLTENFERWTEAHTGEGGWDFAEMEQVWQQRKDKLIRELEPASTRN